MPTFRLASTTNPLPPTVNRDEKRLVEEAVVLKKLVVVAEVPVALTKVKFWRVEEPTTRRSPEELMVEVAEPPMESELPVNRLAKELVEVAEVVVERVMLLKILAPVQVFAVEKSKLIVSPVRVMGEVTARLVSSEISRPETSAVPTVAQVATPRTERTLTN